MSIQQVIDCINDNVEQYEAHVCTYHRNKLCFSIISKRDSKSYHALVDGNSSSQWFRLHESSSSFDYPKFIYYTMKLNETLGNKYVLPYACQLRDSHGIVYFLFDITDSLYTASKINVKNIVYVYIGFIVYISELSKLLGGAMPDLHNMKFFYNDFHPVLADVGKRNCEKKKKNAWQKFMNRTKPTVILRYLVTLMPKFFLKRRHTRCVFKVPDVPDSAHELVCKTVNDSLSEILKKYSNSDCTLYFKEQVEWLLKNLAT